MKRPGRRDSPRLNLDLHAHHPDGDMRASVDPASLLFY